MKDSRLIDTNFDFRSDTPLGKDPDSFSRTLQRYHKLLWSKPLPSGTLFELVDTMPNVYLHHRSNVGEFWLASDAVIPCFTREKKISHIVCQVAKDELDWFNALAYTIGGMMLFPSQRIDRKITINGARGFHPRIKDRFDLTVECIRRHYINEENPLAEVLDRYGDFFRLFEDFRGYVEFFLLQDLVDKKFSKVKFFLPFGGFSTTPLPSTREAYLSYKQLAIDFIEARNRRILEYCEENDLY